MDSESGESISGKILLSGLDLIPQSTQKAVTDKVMIYYQTEVQNR